MLPRTSPCREGVRKGKVQLKFKLGRDGKDIKGLLKVPYQQKTGEENDSVKDVSPTGVIKELGALSETGHIT